MVSLEPFLFFAGVVGVGSCDSLGHNIFSSQSIHNIVFVCASAVQRTTSYLISTVSHLGFPGGASVRELAFPFRRHKKAWVQSLGPGRHSRRRVAASSIRAWRIPWIVEEPGGLPSLKICKEWDLLGRLGSLIHTLSH